MPTELRGATTSAPVADIIRSPLASPGAQGAFVFAGYAVVAFLMWGLKLLHGLNTDYLVGPGTTNDVRFYTWALSWWPHAIGHGLNPLHAGALWAPHGVNMTWVTGIPGPSLVAWPVTSTLGPVVAENILFLLAPPLAGWSAYLLCRRITRSFWASVAGGYLFGFSTYLVGQMRGHLNLVLVFPVALCAYLIVRRLDGSMSERRFVVLLALALLAEFSIAVEVTAGMVVFGAIGLAIAWVVLGRAWRSRIIRTAAAAAVACGLVAIVVSPYVITSVLNQPPPHFTGDGNWANANNDVALQHYSTDLLSYAIPARFVAVGFTQAPGIRAKFWASANEDGAYLGIPLIMMVVAFAILRRRRRSTWLLVALFLVAVLLSLGPRLHVAGSGSVRLPWRLAASVPLVKELLPVRLAMYAWLAVSVISAVWLSEPRKPSAKWVRPSRWALVGLGAIAILPSVPQAVQFATPAIFSEGSWTRWIHPGENVLVLPAYRPSDSLVWQEQAGFGFSLAGGYVGYRGIPAASQSQPGFFALVTNRPRLISPPAFASFIQANRVGVVVVPDRWIGPWRPTLSTLGIEPEHVHHLWIYRLPP